MDFITSSVITQINRCFMIFILNIQDCEVISCCCLLYFKDYFSFRKELSWSYL